MADRALTIALSAVLHGEASDDSSSLGDKFALFVREFTRVLGKAPSWPLATGLLALYSPKRFLAVHPTSLRQQGRWMNEPQMRSNPNPADFERANAMSGKLFEQLGRLGLAPADFFDIYEFVRATTTPAAKKRLEALRQSDVGGSPSETENAGPDDDSDQEAA